MQQKTQPQGTPSSLSADAFIAKWQGKDGSERANYQLFITELKRPGFRGGQLV